ncbi:MAG: NucA/NucB deoxyribonuclease domain-containing protein [Caulobacter sp.]
MTILLDLSRPRAVPLAASLAMLLAAASAAARQPPTITFDGQYFPCIAYNIALAQANGAPTQLRRTTDDTLVSSNRATICDLTVATTVAGINRPLDRRDWVSCDEYPFASSVYANGGQAMIVPLYENNTQGAYLRRFYDTYGLGDGAAFSVVVSNVPATGGGPGRLTITNYSNGTVRCSY